MLRRGRGERVVRGHVGGSSTVIAVAVDTLCRLEHGEVHHPQEVGFRERLFYRLRKSGLGRVQVEDGRAPERAAGQRVARRLTKEGRVDGSVVTMTRRRNEGTRRT